MIFITYDLKRAAMEEELYCSNLTCSTLPKVVLCLVERAIEENEYDDFKDPEVQYLIAGKKKKQGKKMRYRKTKSYIILSNRNIIINSLLQ
jgi:hypothetical protein